MDPRFRTVASDPRYKPIRGDDSDCDDQDERLNNLLKVRNNLYISTEILLHIMMILC